MYHKVYDKVVQQSWATKCTAKFTTNCAKYNKMCKNIDTRKCARKCVRQSVQQTVVTKCRIKCATKCVTKGKTRVWNKECKKCMQ